MDNGTVMGPGNPGVGRPLSRAGRVLALARLSASKRASAMVTIGDAVAALLIEDQGDATRFFPEISGDSELLRGPADQSRKPFFGMGAARRLLSRLDRPDHRFAQRDEYAEGPALCVGIDIENPPPTGIRQPVVPMSQQLHLAFTEAARIQKDFGQHELHPLHLLAAILADESSAGAQICRDAGITREMVIGAIRRESH